MQFVTNVCFNTSKSKLVQAHYNQIDQVVYMDAVWERTTALGTAFMLTGFVLPSVGNGFKTIWHCKHVVGNSSCLNLNLEENTKIVNYGVTKLRFAVEAES